MQKVTSDTSWVRSDQEVLLFELAEGCFYLWPHGKQEVLPTGHERSLAVVGYDHDAVTFPEPFYHGAGRIVAVTNYNLGRFVDQLFDVLRVVLVGWRETDGSQPTFVVDGRVQLETVVPALPVFAPLGNAPCNLVPISPDILAYLKHGAVTEAERSSAREQRAEHCRKHRQ